jgi:transcriptional regulator with XRE-family HTH domain
MPKRARRSPEFGRWVRDAREASNQNQQQLASRASLTQQYLSRIESQGLVPTNEELANLCKALGRTEQEAQEILAVATVSDERGRLLEKEFSNFRKWLLKRSKPVHIFIVRDDPEPVNDISVNMHCEVIRETSDLDISILFRYSDKNSKAWESFRWLAGRIDEKWRKEIKDKPPDEPRRRISGYFRKPDYEEDQGRSIPMGLPVILVVDPTGPHLFYYGSHPEVYKTYVQAGEEDTRALFQSTMLLPAPKEKAALFASWIGPDIMLGLPPHKWEPIPWPGQSGKSNSESK